MTKTLHRFTAGVVVAMAITGLCVRANASIIDLAEKDLASRLHGHDEAVAFIEMDQSLAPGTLTYLNSFGDDEGWHNTVRSIARTSTQVSLTVASTRISRGI